MKLSPERLSTFRRDRSAKALHYGIRRTNKSHRDPPSKSAQKTLREELGGLSANERNRRGAGGLQGK